MPTPIVEYKAQSYEVGGSVVWVKSDHGKYTTDTGTDMMVFTPHHAIVNRLVVYITWAIQEFAKIRECGGLLSKDMKLRNFSLFTTPAAAVLYVKHTIPGVYSFNRADAAIRRRAVDFVLAKSQTLAASDIASSDAELLLSIGLKRDYKGECAICLTDKIMGTTCACGHTDTAVFAPCGHALCADPCYELFAEAAGVHLKDLTSCTTNGKEFIIHKIKELVAIDKPCPLCRQPIAHVFRAEDISVPPKWLPEIDVIADDIIAHTNWI